MALDTATLSSLTCRFEPTAYLSCTPWTHRTTPRGMGDGKTRFASPTDQFKLLYIAEDLATGIAETVVRDRFEGAPIRELDIMDVRPWAVCEVDAVASLRVLDLRRDGCLKLGITAKAKSSPASKRSNSWSFSTKRDRAWRGLSRQPGPHRIAPPDARADILGVSAGSLRWRHRAGVRRLVRRYRTIRPGGATLA